MISCDLCFSPAINSATQEENSTFYQLCRIANNPSHMMEAFERTTSLFMYQYGNNFQEIKTVCYECLLTRIRYIQPTSQSAVSMFADSSSRMIVMWDPFLYDYEEKANSGGGSSIYWRRTVPFLQPLSVEDRLYSGG